MSRSDRSLSLAILLVIAFAAPRVVTATLVIEPVFMHVEGSGPDDLVVGLYNLDVPNGATGEPFATADEPGEIVTYPVGFPRDEELVTDVRFYNNTAYLIDGFILSIVGTADEPERFNFTVERGEIDAIWGDANGDGAVGLSDIFDTITVSEDGKTIRFSGGLIAPGDRFTDYVFSTRTEADDPNPFRAAVDARFTGVQQVPEPGTLALLLGGILSMWWFAGGRVAQRDAERDAGRR